MNIAQVSFDQSHYSQDMKVVCMIVYLEYARKDVAKIDRHAEALLVAAIKRLRLVAATEPAE